jgi:hypothetical protein
MAQSQRRSIKQRSVVTKAQRKSASKLQAEILKVAVDALNKAALSKKAKGF